MALRGCHSNSGDTHKHDISKHDILLWIMCDAIGERVRRWERERERALPLVGGVITLWKTREMEKVITSLEIRR